ncbi:hypothetical protein D3C71_1758000 [compost metagenome]
MTSQPAFSDCSARSVRVPDRAFIDRSSDMIRPENPRCSRIRRMPFFEVVAGRLASMAVKTTWAVMAIGMSDRALNGAKSQASSVSRSVSTTGRSWWLSEKARPWPGMCLMIGRTPPASRPSAAARPSWVTVAGSWA